ncbi:hypothetical protein FH972_025534 [Carpinus fangiana]|uniref:ML-like domain-containing protein n=1 Tax=Carpinus fangiana TaxID=176857 RepID=A0A5N6L1Q3_9ROSI|nr:hypothetical protein FH972_025534 [Carpinus fangiana]
MASWLSNISITICENNTYPKGHASTGAREQETTQETKTDTALSTTSSPQPIRLCASGSHDPPKLQWIPLFFDAVFNETDPANNLRVTVYGNVTGQTFAEAIGAPGSDYWSDPTRTNGKITDVSQATNKLSVMDGRYNLLTYTPWASPPLEFCRQLTEGTVCPIGPVFNTSYVAPLDLPGFTQNHNFNTTYAFSTLSATIHVNSGDDDANGRPITVACVSAPITPALGSTLSNVITYLPVAILFLVALAVVCASIFSPWGSTDPFKWSSNYGRDGDLIRLVTPGFGDCLQYIQFVVLAGSLSLNYPGFFQPIVSQASWSALMFNNSFVTHGNGTPNPVDGIYVTHGKYGLRRMSQLVGMTDVDDIWAGTIIWVLVIIGVVIVVCQLGFIISWGLRKLASHTPEDLRNKNWPLTGGNFVRIVCNYFLLPIVALSFFQLINARHSPAYVVALSAVLIVALMCFAGWILRVIFKANPRSALFDDLPTVLLYGPLYNTYSDDAAPFALIPALLTFIRGIAIGAVQPSGIAQLVMLAICEVILILTLNAFRPFHSPTSMNAYHTFFSSARLAAVLLSVAFVPNLGVTEAPRGWIGYTILLLHAVVLIFGFFLNAIQTLIEVGARVLGAGGDSSTGAATRGGLVKAFGMRQLSRRARRPEFRRSMHSDAAILTQHDNDAKSQYGGRSRSISASSAILLNKPGSRDRMSGYMDQVHSAVPSADIETPVTRSTHEFPDMAGTAYSGASSGRPSLGLRSAEAAAPYYRAPRQRRTTGELVTPGARSRGSWVDGNWIQAQDDSPPQDGRDFEMVNRPFSPERTVVSPGYLREREGSDSMVNRRGDVDYAVREVDFYYGVRGPALNAQPTRKLKTGPADPVGPVSSATGWFKNIFGGKSKESGKGFEVVRSSRAPPPGFEEETSPTPFHEPYQDTPSQVQQAEPGAVLPGQRTRRRASESNSDSEDIGTARRSDHIDAPSPMNSDDEQFDGRTSYDAGRYHHSRIVSNEAPNLGPIDMGGDINIPSRMGSRATTVPSRASTRRDAPQQDAREGRIPALPKIYTGSAAVPPVGARPPPSSFVDPTQPGRRSSRVQRNAQLGSQRIPFTSNSGSNGNVDSRASSGHQARSSIGTVLSDYDVEERDALAGNQEPTGEIARHALGLPGAEETPERPASTGFVNQYRASDGLRIGGESTSSLGRSAEVGRLEDDDEVAPGRARGGKRVTMYCNYDCTAMSRPFT